MSESAIRSKIEELVDDQKTKECLLRLIELERGSSTSATYTVEYKRILQELLDSTSGEDVRS